MNDELKQKKLLFYAIAYVTNFEYVIIMALLSFFLELDKNIYIPVILSAIPAVISVILSVYLFRDDLISKITKEQEVIKLGLAHIPSLLGLTAALVYLFVL